MSCLACLLACRVLTSAGVLSPCAVQGLVSKEYPTYEQISVPWRVGGGDNIFMRLVSQWQAAVAKYLDLKHQEWIWGLPTWLNRLVCGWVWW